MATFFVKPDYPRRNCGCCGWFGGIVVVSLLVFMFAGMLAILFTVIKASLS